MRSYWVWFLALALVWIFASIHLYENNAVNPWRLASGAGFFALFFLAPLFRKKPVTLTIILSGASVFVTVALWPESGGNPNPYSLLILSILAGKAVYRLPLPLPLALGVGLILIIGASMPYFAGYPAFPPMFTTLYALLLGLALAIFRKTWDGEAEASARSEALLSEYRKVKRRLASEEALARQEERTQIARDIHDSVGHKLTALLMQLEAARMQTDGETEARLRKLKELAKESLEETRRAVKSLKRDEIGGLSAILSLIRKLEAESFIRVQFSVRHGALSTPLSPEQSVAVYRTVQEALTNIMRHSKVREAEIMFEAPSGRVFRFEISNPSIGDVSFKEGFGLASMRERLEQVGGRLEILQYNGLFTVRGTLHMPDKERVVT